MTLQKTQPAGPVLPYPGRHATMLAHVQPRLIEHPDRPDSILEPEERGKLMDRAGAAIMAKHPDEFANLLLGPRTPEAAPLFALYEHVCNMVALNMRPGGVVDLSKEVVAGLNDQVAELQSRVNALEAAAKHRK